MNFHDLARGFSLLRTSTGDLLSLSDLHFLFANQRARGSESAISQETEDLLLATVAGLRQETSVLSSSTLDGDDTSSRSSQLHSDSNGTSDTHENTKAASAAEPLEGLAHKLALGQMMQRSQLHRASVALDEVTWELETREKQAEVVDDTMLIHIASPRERRHLTLFSDPDPDLVSRPSAPPPFRLLYRISRWQLARSQWDGPQWEWHNSAVPRPTSPPNDVLDLSLVRMSAVRELYSPVPQPFGECSVQRSNNGPSRGAGMQLPYEDDAKLNHILSAIAEPDESATGFEPEQDVLRHDQRVLRTIAHQSGTHSAVSIIQAQASVRNTTPRRKHTVVVHSVSTNFAFDRALIARFNAHILPTPEDLLAVHWLSYQPINKLRQSKAHSSIVLHVSSKRIADRLVSCYVMLDDIPHRTEHVKLRESLCYNCFDYGHISRHCRRRSVCGICAGGHHTRACACPHFVDPCLDLTSCTHVILKCAVLGCGGPHRANDRTSCPWQ